MAQHGTLVIALSINPRPLSALELTLSGLIMGSRVDTAGDNQSPNVIISISIKTDETEELPGKLKMLKINSFIYESTYSSSLNPDFT